MNFMSIYIIYFFLVCLIRSNCLNPSNSKIELIKLSWWHGPFSFDMSRFSLFFRSLVACPFVVIITMPQLPFYFCPHASSAMGCNQRAAEADLLPSLAFHFAVSLSLSPVSCVLQLEQYLPKAKQGEAYFTDLQFCSSFQHYSIYQKKKGLQLQVACQLKWSMFEQISSE